MNEIVQSAEKNDYIENILAPQSAFSVGRWGWEKANIYYISDIHLEHHLTNDKSIKKQINEIVKGLFDEEILNELSSWIRYKKSIAILFGGDIAADDMIYKTFFNSICTFLKKKLGEDASIKNALPIYVVLGNHELHNFSKVEDAVSFYKGYFDELPINFVHNCEYDNTTFKIVGGIGFAKNNEVYNVNTICTTTPSMSRADEIEESEKFMDVYRKSVNSVIYEQCPLIVLTHYPTIDWIQQNEYSDFVTYYSGHDHRNKKMYYDGCQEYSDNQIGYENKRIKFKSNLLGTLINPFANYEDGVHMVTIEQYRQFYDFSCERLQGTGLIDQQMSTGNAIFYMIKKKGFYGFFVVNKRTGTKICVGGKVETVSKITDINYFSDSFELMVNYYIKQLLPYRKIQEKISQEVKNCGYSGKIHGCIVDVDFYHHIMVNPLDGTVKFYFSPVFGMVNSFNSFEELLLSIETYNEKNLIEQKEFAITTAREMKKDKTVLVVQKKAMIEKMIKIDIKNSIYSISSHINQLQRLFDSNILRAWNDEWVREIVGDSKKYSQIYDYSVRQSNLDNKIKEILLENGIKSFKSIHSRQQLKRYKGLGNVSINKICEYMSGLGINI